MSESSQPSEGHEGRRERKKRATRLALRAAAFDLVADRGFAKVTVEDIAESVDVSVRTFFNYFSSKEEALVGDDPELVERTCAELLALPASYSPVDALEEVLVNRLRAVKEDLELSGEDHWSWKRRFAAVRSHPEVQAAYAKHMAGIEHALTDALCSRLGGEQHRAYAAAVTASALAVMRTVGTLWGGEGGVSLLIDETRRAFALLRSGFALEPADHPVPTCAVPARSQILTDSTSDRSSQP